MNQVWTVILIVVAVVFARGTAAQTIDEGNDETGTVSFTRELFLQLFFGPQKAVEAKKLGLHRYRATKPIGIDIIIKPPTDCWKLFNTFMQNNAAIFKAWANKYCRNFMGCWCCPGGGLCVTFFVPPDYQPCQFTAIAYAQELKTHEF